MGKITLMVNMDCLCNKLTKDTNFNIFGPVVTEIYNVVVFVLAGSSIISAKIGKKKACHNTKTVCPTVLIFESLAFPAKITLQTKFEQS